MYKTGIISDEVSQDLAVAAKLASQYRLDALEIRSVGERNLFQMDRQDFARIKEVTGAHNLAICGISSPLFKCSLDSSTEYHQHLEGLKRCVEAANLWQTDIIRAFTFWQQEGVELKAIGEKFQKAIEIARDGGVTLVIESEPSVNTRNTKQLVEFLQLLRSPHVAALWDPGNEIADPKAPPPYPDGYALLKPYIRHVHIKDIKAKPTGAFYEPALMSRGDVDFHGVFRQLRQDDYQGYVSVETHFRIQKEQLEDALLARPQGSSFSEGGYEASVAYLNILKDEYNWMGEVT